MHIAPLALAAGLLACGGAAYAQAATPPGSQALEPSPAMLPLPRGEAAARQPILLQAQSIRSQPDLETAADGNVEFRRGSLVIRADHLRYDAPQDLVRGLGHVRVSRDGAVYSGPELELQVQRFEGYFLQPRFEFLRFGSGGSADRIDFLGEGRSRATRASYTSCPRDGPEEPDWVLRTRSVTLDLDANEGRAEGAVLRFLGTPILALPSLSFPLGDERKSGWLPPTINLDSRSGVDLSVPYYWNIAPNRDATLAPRVITRRGLALDAEFRYLEPGFSGSAMLDWLPNDRAAGRSRQGLQWQHEGRLEGGLVYRGDLVRVSDDDWWKDFPNENRSLTARLLPLHLALERPFVSGSGQGLVYVRATRWQVLQAADSFITSPYERSPQLGVQWAGRGASWEFALESEFNRFTLPQGQEASTRRPAGDRIHLLGALSRPFREPGWWVVPRLSFNAASYSGTDVPPATLAHATRVIPTFSVDAGLELERRTELFGRALHQTLEPRLLYVNTPYRAQSQLPNYDSWAKDFNFVTLYTDNAFSGIDRVSDAHQITAGVTTRLVDAASGAEALRLGLAQRTLLRTQRVAPQADGTPDGEALTQRLSDLLLLGSTSVLPSWALDATVQYSPEISRSVRSIVGARYAPGPYRTVGATYRFTRGLSEQLELGWQWPLFGAAGPPPVQRASSGGACGGTWYSVGRVNYSMKDTRVTDSVLGLEYDAGCWVARVVATRLSTGLNEATTRLSFQLELTGLSKLNVGSNPLQVLKDNIPGYRLLREEAPAAAPPFEDPPTVPPSHD
jgi:LPS-assembly protein